MIGWGGVGVYPQKGFTFTASYPEFKVSPIVVIEPSVLAELNLTKFLRPAVGAGYTDSQAALIWNESRTLISARVL